MTDRNDKQARENLLTRLFGEKMEAIRKGDLEKLREIEERMFYAGLDFNDPDYAEKVAAHQRNRRIRDAGRRAEQVMEATGEAMSFTDRLNAINEVVDRAVESFEQMPCPKCAADLLGLIACRDLLLESEPIITLDPGREFIEVYFAGSETDE